MPSIEIRRYLTAAARSPFDDWLGQLKDRRAVQAIMARMTRLAVGNRGDWKSVGAGVFELRIDVGAGYRVYCGQDGEAVVLLLCGGDKRTQRHDIEVAHAYWKDYKSRTR